MRKRSYLKVSARLLFSIIFPLVCLIVTFGVGTFYGMSLGKTTLPERVMRKISEVIERGTGRIFAKTRTFKTERIQTGLTTLEIVRIPIGKMAGGGGALTEVENHILFATPKGKIGFLRRRSDGIDYEIKYINGRVPMRYAELKKSAIWENPLFNSVYFRTLDMLVLRKRNNLFHLYVSHHRYADNCIEFVVSRVAIFVAPDLITVDYDAWEDVFVAKPCIRLKETGHAFAGLQAGGRLVKMEDNKLLVAVGDFEFDGVNAAEKAPMDLRNDLGKAIEININTKEAKIFAVGLRNPQGLFVSSDGAIWETEHGPQGGDEVNILRQGENYGWPAATYGLMYGFPRRDWPLSDAQSRHDRHTKPAYAFMPSIGISSLIEATGDSCPLWKGDLLVTSLRSTAIWRLRRDGEKIIYGEKIEFKDRLRDIQALSNGQFVVFSDSGNLIIISCKAFSRDKTPKNIRVRGFNVVRDVFAEYFESAPNREPDAVIGKKLFTAYCSNCHSVSKEHGAGPYLSGVFGRKIGSLMDYPYSDTLSNAEGAWTEGRLIDFLSDPKKQFSGTSMPQVILPIEHYGPIIEYLKEAR